MRKKRTVVENAHAVVEGMRGELCLGVLQGCFGDLSARERLVFDELGSWSLGRSEPLGVDGHSSPAVFFHLGCSGGHCFEWIQVTCGGSIEEVVKYKQTW